MERFFPGVKTPGSLRKNANPKGPQTFPLERVPSRASSASPPHTGSPCSPTTMPPTRRSWVPGSREAGSTAAGGRSTNSDLSYFNLELPGNQGMIVVVGLAGPVGGAIYPRPGGGLRTCAGQELTRFKLHPGEEVRSPLIALQFWQGDRVRSQNVWRRWMLAHNLPRTSGGKPLPPISVRAAAGSSPASGPARRANANSSRPHPGRREARLLVDRRRLVCVCGLAADRHLGARPDALSAGLRAVSDLVARERDGAHCLV